MPTPRSVTLYTLNLALLTTHQADAVAWREWELLAVPGGLPFFLIFNLVAVLLLSLGLAAVAAGHALARRAALGCAGVGAFTCALHAVLLMREPQAFSTAPSLLILGAIGATSVAQAIGAWRTTG